MYLNASASPCADDMAPNSTAALSFLRHVSQLFSRDQDRVSLVDDYVRVLRFLRDNCSSPDLEQAVNRSYEHYLISFDSDTYSSTFFYIVATIWVLIGLIGLIGNVFVLLVLCRNDNKLVYEVFCIGLAITDLIFLCLAVPMTIIHYIFEVWLFGAFLCKLANYIVLVTVYASSLMLLGLTTSRFLAVVHPWKNRKIKVGRAKLACVGAWLIGITCSLPVLILYSILRVQDDSIDDEAQNRTLCVDNGFPSESRAAYQIFTVMVTCVVPFSSIIVMNSMIVLRLQREVNKSDNQRPDTLSCREQRKKKLRAKVTKLVIIVTTLYCVCWLPTHVMNTWYNVHRNSFPQRDYMMILKTISQSLSYASCCVNPIVYSAISGSFKAAIFKQFPRLSRVFRRGSIEGEVEGNRTELVTYRSPSLFRTCRGTETAIEEERGWKGSERLLSIDRKHSRSMSASSLPGKTIQTNGVVAVVVVAGQHLLHQEEKEAEAQQPMERQQQQQQRESLSTNQQPSQQQTHVSVLGGAKRPTSLPGQPRHQKHSSGSTASASNDPHSSVPSITWSTGSPAELEPRSAYLRMSAV